MPNARAYPDSSHCRSASLAPMLSSMLGNATLIELIAIIVIAKMASSGTSIS